MDDPIDSPKLHPLRATSQRRPREDTVDTSLDDQHATSQDTYTERLFGFPGRGTQGPAGSMVPEGREEERGGRAELMDDDEDPDSTYDYMDDEGEAPPDSAGPISPLSIQPEDYARDEGMEEASEVATRAARLSAAAAAAAAGGGGGGGGGGAGGGRVASDPSEAVLLQEMEAAEREWEARQAAAAGAGHGRGADARLLSKLWEQQSQSAPGSPRSTWGPAGAAAPFGALAAPGSPRSPRQAGGAGGSPDVTADTRQRVVEHLAASLRANPAFAAASMSGQGSGEGAGQGAGQGAAEVASRRCEEALFASSHSKAVYLSLASNAVRVARSVADVADLPRIAAGQPKPTPGYVDTTSCVTGLQGYVLKPEY